MLSPQKRKELVLTLDENVVSIVFTKSNGEQRTMRCTLIEDYLPHVKDPVLDPWNNSNCAVWDIDEDGWRSFRFDTIQRAEYTDGIGDHFELVTEHLQNVPFEYVLSTWCPISERSLY